MGLCFGGHYLIKGALSALKTNDPQSTKQQAIAEIFAHQFMAQTSGVKQQIIKGAPGMESQTNEILGV
jgi:hypothetical protein